jgi:hypothetical protein
MSEEIVKENTDEIVPDTTRFDPMISGWFALYEDGEGGFVLVTETDKGGLQRKHIPSAIVKIATGGGILGRKLGSLFG